MRKNRGFGLGFKLGRVFKWAIHRRKHQRLNPTSYTTKAMSILCNWGRSLKNTARGLCFSPNSKPGYIRVGEDLIGAKSAGVPKGHLAVYVGEKEDDTHRYLVPVIYFNHPLFGNLLREAEREFGQGGRWVHSDGIEGGRGGAVVVGEVGAHSDEREGEDEGCSCAGKRGLQLQACNRV